MLIRRGAVLVVIEGGPETPGTKLVYSDAQLRISRLSYPLMLRLTGEIDAFNATAVANAVTTALQEPGDLHVDASQLLFCDVTGIRALVSSALGLEGRRLVLHGLDPHLRKVIELVGWGEIDGLEIAKNGYHPH
jgi:anti-anti-sigma factor